ncbi:hypothetical protein NQ318_020520 [Aromia moschata]|uniref:protein xylosyltransferase n=1 Tax=Aromia moschata TaxID=1265417 RepID=A0AAV8Z244_9CUCU|nr:hypothetical protein NQ318_020520 [Aromia moschata]
MVKNNPKNNKWMRRYRTFFVIGFVILCLQIFLAARFVALNKNTEPDENHWVPLNIESELDQEVEANSARKSKLDNFDDEDSNAISPKSKKQKVVNQTHLLRYDELEFVPPCSITTREAVSAINRAKTQKCKQLISNITCLSYADKLYPIELRGSCPAEGFVPGRELGCFKDDKKFRLLSGYFGVNKNENSPKYCMKLCLQSGFPYAGVQYSNECFCGVDEPPLSSKIPDSSCNLKCPGDQHATCGGYYTINVYQTGIKSKLFLLEREEMCDNFVFLEFVPQIANTEVTGGSNSSVKIVFLLTLNGRAVRQVKRLLKVLYHKNHYYYIHVDVRQDYLYRELLSLEKVLPNVRLTRRRFATIWGGASLLEMLRSCMWELLNIKEWKWDFVLNLSESDFPVKTVAQLTQFLTANRHRNFVKSHGREVQRFIQKQGLDKTFVECETRMWRVGDRQLPHGVQIDGGSDWIALSRKFVDYVREPGTGRLSFGIFKHTLLPAESFFHTALRNSKFCDTYIDNNLHVTNWKRKLGCKCQYKHVVDWCGCSPNDFTPDDWPRILSTISRQLYFARKFEPIINQAVILQLELWLYGLEEPSKRIPNLDSYWQSVYHYRDLGVTPDDGLLTLGNSVKRHVLRKFNQSNLTSCDVQIFHLMQVHTFHNKDAYRYSLFLLNTTDGVIEVAVKPVRNLVLMKPSPLMEHVQVLLLRSEGADLEEFLQVLSPFSEPVLVYRFSALRGSKIYNLTCLWISPSGHLQDVTDFTVDELSLIGHVKSALRQPVLPGVWTTKLIYKNTLLAEVKFLVTPLEFITGRPVQKLVPSLFSGRLLNTSKQGEGLYEKFLPNASQRAILEKINQSDSEREGNLLSSWIDGLFSKFYGIEKVCMAGVRMVTYAELKLVLV